MLIASRTDWDHSKWFSLFNLWMVIWNEFLARETTKGVKEIIDGDWEPVPVEIVPLVSFGGGVPEPTMADCNLWSSSRALIQWKKIDRERKVWENCSSYFLVMKDYIYIEKIRPTINCMKSRIHLNFHISKTNPNFSKLFLPTTSINDLNPKPPYWNNYFTHSEATRLYFLFACITPQEPMLNGL